MEAFESVSLPILQCPLLPIQHYTLLAVAHAGYSFTILLEDKYF